VMMDLLTRIRRHRIKVHLSKSVPDDMMGIDTTTPITFGTRIPAAVASTARASKCRVKSRIQTQTQN
jgi:hypothetical protein